jgi:hypothetical protein
MAMQIIIPTYIRAQIERKLIIGNSTMELVKKFGSMIKNTTRAITADTRANKNAPLGFRKYFL